VTDTVKENEVGKIFAINAKFDLSANTELRMVFVQPDSTVITKLKADGVQAPSVPLTLKINGVETTFLADEYWQYASESGLLTPTGQWDIHGEYVDATPKDFAGDVSNFTVLPRT